MSLVGAPTSTEEDSEAVARTDDGGAGTDELAVLLKEPPRRAMAGRRGSRRPKGPSGLAWMATAAERRARGSDESIAVCRG